MDDIKAENLEYRPVTQNSNTAVDRSLDAAGLDYPKDDGVNEHWSPSSLYETTGSHGRKLRLLEEKFIDPKPSPLVLDLDGDGIELTALDSSSTYFDLNINGFAELTGWVSSDDALLALDVNGDGIINDGSELFGDQTGHDHGFLALAVHDDNGDGVIDASDAVFSDLVVWQDLNGDGISQNSYGINVNRMNTRAINLNAANDTQSPGIKLAA